MGLAVAIHQQMLYWQTALWACDLKPETKEVNIFQPNPSVWSSQHNQLTLSLSLSSVYVHHQLPEARSDSRFQYLLIFAAIGLIFLPGNEIAFNDIHLNQHSEHLAEGHTSRDSGGASKTKNIRSCKTSQTLMGGMMTNEGVTQWEREALHAEGLRHP